MLRHREDCRACHSKDVVKFLSLGDIPLAGGFVKEEEIPEEKKYPLEVYFCRNCSLAQIMDIVPPDILFKDYRYLSSVMLTLAKHFEMHAKDVVSRYNLDKNSFAVEIGPNDGVLMKPLQDFGINVVGFEPAENIAEIAVSKGLQIIKDYFTENNATKLVESHGKADVILANNVFAHIDDIDEIMKGISKLLKDEGVFIFEVHYIIDLIEKLQFDTIYHEHLMYYSIKALQKIMNRYGMEIVDVKRIPIHSGSISVHAKKTNIMNNIDSSVLNLLGLEYSLGLHSEEAYFEFADKVKEIKNELLTLINDHKSKNKRIICYGAPGRGTTLLNYVGIDKKQIDYVIDQSPERYGRFMPGVQIPIYPPERLREEINPPDYALILAWSYEEEILKKEQDFISKGGKFIIPLPKIKVIPS